MRKVIFFSWIYLFFKKKKRDNEKRVHQIVSSSFYKNISVAGCRIELILSNNEIFPRCRRPYSPCIHPSVHPSSLFLLSLHFHSSIFHVNRGHAPQLNYVTHRSRAHTHCGGLSVCVFIAGPSNSKEASGKFGNVKIK